MAETKDENNEKSSFIAQQKLKQLHSKNRLQVQFTRLSFFLIFFLCFVCQVNSSKNEDT